MFTDASFEAFSAVMFQVEVSWVVTPCSVVVGTNVSEVHAASIFTLTQRHNLEDLDLKRMQNFVRKPQGEETTRKT
jgi:hypothetical protein